MISLGYLGLLEILSKLETRQTSNIVRKKNKQERTYERFKKCRNNIVALTRISREGYDSKYFSENKKDIKRIWSYIRTIVNVKLTKRYQPSSLVIENKALLNLNIISNHFNKLLVKQTKRLGKVTKNHKALYENQIKIVFLRFLTFF